MLRINNLSKSYKAKRALRDVCFDIKNGERVALLGANGSGKITVIRAICGLLGCEEGEIYFKNQKIKLNSKYLNNLGVVLEGSRNTNWRLTPEQNAKYFSGLKCLSWKSCKNNFDSLLKYLNSLNNK